MFISSLENHYAFAASFIYGFNTIQARRTLWEDLRRWSPNSLWLVLGDFNFLLSKEDKHNGAHITSYEVSDFRECYTDLGLVDLNSTGCFFTWSNGHVWSKLDRVLANPLWFSLPQQTHVHFDNPGVFSNHSPASVQLDPQQPRGNRNFKFFNMWADHPHFLEVISQGWNTQVNGSCMYSLYRKLKCLKRPLKELNKLHFSHISERVARAEADLATHQSLLHHDRDNTQLLSQERNLRSSLLNLKYTEQMFFGQKLKSYFLKEADKGSRFFHSLMSQKHQRNHIPAIKFPLVV